MKRRVRRASVLVGLPALLAAGALAACSSDGDRAARPSTTVAAEALANPATAHGDHGDHAVAMRQSDRIAAQLATAGFQDVATAEKAGYASTLDTLGCFQDPTKGGMGVHYVNQALMDAHLDIAKPEALVYELDASGAITGLVAHEYIVPVDAWTSPRPPTLFGVPLHRHPTLPLWVLHTWVWKDNPAGIFNDWNPAVRMCPDGVPIFGRDQPTASSPTPARR